MACTLSAITVPPITLPEHGAVHNARCGRPHPGRGRINHMRTKGVRRTGIICEHPLWTDPMLNFL